MNNLDEYVKNYDYRAGIMGGATDYCTGIFLRHMSQGSVLELGPAEGVMTEKMYPLFHDYTVVEGSKDFSKQLKMKYPDMEVVNCFFEDFEPTKTYDYIILGHVLEHVDNPVHILKLCSEWLSIGGKILSAVPNAHSIHRQAAVKMGILRSENELNDTDKGVGHQRVYNLVELSSDFNSAGLSIIKSGGYFLKPLANSQIEKTWTPEMISAFMELGENYPELAGEIYIIAERNC